MADQTFQLTRKLRYVDKFDDSFIVKYTIQIDPGNPAMALPSKTQRQPSMQKIKKQSFRQDEVSRQKYRPVVKQPPLPQYDPNRQTKQQRKDRRVKRTKKLLELKPEAAEVFKKFNKYNSKKMKIINNDDRDDGKVKYQKGGKKKKQRETRISKVPGIIDEGSQSEDLDEIYDLKIDQPQIRKRMSRSIDNTEKQQQPSRVQERMSKFYDAKKNKKAIYPAYLNADDIEDSRDANQNKYFKGTIDFNERVKNYARIFSKQIEGDLIVEGINKNRCIHGDTVYFEVIPKQQVPNGGHQRDTMDEKIRCRVVYIQPWKKNEKRKIVGKIQFTRSNNTYYLVPINKRIMSFDVKFSDISRQNLKKVDQKYFLAEFTEWRDTDQYPSCRIISQYGALGEIQTQTGALLINNGVQDKEYDEQTIQKGLQKFLKCADDKGEYKISEEQIKRRSDLRNEFIFTIDPLTAKDFDDALSILQCGKTQTGEIIYEVGVHIADASFFVEEGGVIDERAQLTTTSVYLVHRVLPMLPRVLCQTMCSLNPGLERLTLSVWFKLTASGVLLPGNRFDRSVIKSKARFTYEQAQRIIDKKVNTQQEIEPGFGCVKSEQFDRIASDLRIMNAIAVKVRQARIKGGSLIFETPKKSFNLDHNYYPESFNVGKRFQANFLVEQYMLLANQKVGQILVENIKSSALLRRHKFPSDKKIQKFQKFTLKINHPIKIDKNSPMQEQMNQIMKNPKVKQCIKDVLNYQMIFLLEQAQYFVVGDIPKSQWLHYALNMPVYTHFTSPIRRYPDIMVHRQLISVINARNDKIPMNQIKVPSYKKLKQIVDRCNKNKVSAKKVSSGCEKIFMCLYLKAHPVFCKAVLTDLNQYCLSVCVPSYDFRSVIQFKQLKKVKTLQFDKDSSQRKYVQLQCEYEPQAFIKIIVKQMQEIDVRLTAKPGFPIDYMIRLILPHPKDFTTNIVCE